MTSFECEALRQRSSLELSLDKLSARKASARTPQQRALIDRLIELFTDLKATVERHEQRVLHPTGD